MSDFGCGPVDGIYNVPSLKSTTKNNQVTLQVCNVSVGVSDLWDHGFHIASGSDERHVNMDIFEFINIMKCTLTSSLHQWPEVI